MLFLSSMSLRTKLENIWEVNVPPNMGNKWNELFIIFFFCRLVCRSDVVNLHTLTISTLSPMVGWVRKRFHFQILHQELNNTNEEICIQINCSSEIMRFLLPVENYFYSPSSDFHLPVQHPGVILTFEKEINPNYTPKYWWTKQKPTCDFGFKLPVCLRDSWMKEILAYCWRTNIPTFPYHLGQADSSTWLNWYHFIQGVSVRKATSKSGTINAKEVAAAGSFLPTTAGREKWWTHFVAVVASEQRMRI